MKSQFQTILDSMPVITLDEMSQVKLMNRLDRKYLATESQLLELLNMAQGEYMVQVADGLNYGIYHTTYYDDASHTMYMLHHGGRLCRQKVRVRNYNGGLTFFEVKLKDNHGRTRKKRINVSGFDHLEEDGAGRFLDEKGSLGIPLSEMRPTVENFFERITLVNKGMTERLTIDTGLRFHNLETGMERQMSPLVVIEVKRDGNVESPVIGMLLKLRIRPSGFSKYCIGSALTNPELKQNRFMKKIRKINKMTGYYE